MSHVSNFGICVDRHAGRTNAYIDAPSRSNLFAHAMLRNMGLPYGNDLTVEELASHSSRVEEAEWTMPDLVEADIDIPDLEWTMPDLVEADIDIPDLEWNMPDLVEADQCIYRSRLSSSDLEAIAWKNPSKDKCEDGSECMICIEGFKPDDRCLELCCGHLFHLDCIKKWLVMNARCPICRSIYSLKKECKR